MRSPAALVSASLTAVLIALSCAPRADARPARHSRHTSAAHAAKKQAQAAPPDTFLRRPAATPLELSRQVAADERVRTAYARYFGLPESEAAGRLQGLTAAALTSSGEFTEYRRHGNGVIYPVRVSLARGTRIFAAPDRSLRLLAGSGDPIVPFAPVVKTIIAPAPPPRPPVEKEIVVPADPTVVIQRGTEDSPTVIQQDPAPTAPASPPAAP